MIISYKHQFIFIHCRKTAGSTITAYLSKYLADSDVQIGSWPDCALLGIKPNKKSLYDAFRVKSIPGLGFLLDRSPNSWLLYNYSRLINRLQKNRYTKILDPNPEHPLASDLQAFDPYAWNNFYKFCFVRNPFDKTVSEYLWCCRQTGINISFHDFLLKLSQGYISNPIIPPKHNNWIMYTIDDKVAVDFIGKFENLSEDFAYILDKVGLPHDLSKMPTAKNSDRKSSYRKWYGQQERKIVESLYRKELEEFGYNF